MFPVKYTLMIIVNQWEGEEEDTGPGARTDPPNRNEPHPDKRGGGKPGDEQTQLFWESHTQ